MNKKRILELAAVIEQAQHHTDDLGFIDGEVVTLFSMSVWRCGTTACIGGWTQALFTARGQMFSGTISVAEVLGISFEKAEALCYPGDMSIGRYEDITPAEAADTLRRLAATGKVEWKTERPDPVAEVIQEIAQERREHEPVRQMETEFA